MVSLQDTFITFAVIGIFTLAMITFGVNLQVENGVNNTILENDIINRTFINLEGNLSELGGESQTQKNNFDEDIPERGFGSLIVFAIVGVGQTVTSMVVSVYNVLIVLPASVLGISSTVLGIFGSILLISLVLLAWRVYRVGS